MRVEVESFGTLKAHLVCLYSSQTSKKGVYGLPAALISRIATHNPLCNLLIKIMSSSFIDKMFEITHSRIIAIFVKKSANFVPIFGKGVNFKFEYFVIGR